MTTVVLTCPGCGFNAGYQGLHEHIARGHASWIVIESESVSRCYELVCPVCGESYRQAIKPGYRDDAFVGEFETEIRLVGADMLLQHLIGEHPDVLGVPDWILSGEEHSE
ncbi:MAG: hypothetical protein ACYDHP_12600 [Ferrimicrobium sp.]